MSKNFLFLELRDKEICTLLLQLREIFTGKRSKSNIHITVRGPYERPLTEKDIRPFSDLVEGDIIKIGGVGAFNNNDFHVVYLAVNSQHLRKIWWKPDYPISKYDFNPHISLYSGSDAALALKIEEFLKHEDLKLDCSQFELTPYASQQYCLLQDEQRRFQKHFLRLILNDKVKGDILERAQSLISGHQSAEHG